MKTKLSIVVIAGLFLSLLFASCSKDKGPQDSKLFVGTYQGSISYKSDDDDISIGDGKITVSNAGDTYNFTFSDGIPNINNIRFASENDEYYINIGGTGTSYIRINKDVLKILYISDGKTWTANCTR